MKTDDKKKKTASAKPSNGKSSNGKPSNKKDYKPWEKMNSGKAKPVDGKAPAKKPVKEFRSFLYLLPKKTGVKDLAKVLDFVEKKNLEMWEDEVVVEITTAGGTITFEDIRDSLEKTDEKVLNDLRMKQVLACDYESTDAELVKKIMGAFLKAFGGKIGSDTEDFQPFMNTEEL